MIRKFNSVLWRYHCNCLLRTVCGSSANSSCRKIWQETSVFPPKWNVFVEMNCQNRSKEYWKHKVSQIDCIDEDIHFAVLDMTQRFIVDCHVFCRNHVLETKQKVCLKVTVKILNFWKKEIQSRKSITKPGRYFLEYMYFVFTLALL